MTNNIWKGTLTVGNGGPGGKKRVKKKWWTLAKNSLRMVFSRCYWLNHDLVNITHCRRCKKEIK